MALILVDIGWWVFILAGIGWLVLDYGWYWMAGIDIGWYRVTCCSTSWLVVIKTSESAFEGMCSYVLGFFLLRSGDAAEVFFH